jgi:plasmid stabilization system protein ParE
MMRLEHGRFVEADLQEIADYIAQDNPTRAVTFIAEIGARFHVIAESPWIYRLRPEIGETARLCTHGHYVILFRIVDDVVRIERVAFGGRDLTSLYSETD